VAAAKRKKRTTRRKRKTRQGHTGLWLAIMVAVAALLIWAAVEVSRRSAGSGFRLPSPAGSDPPEITNRERQRLDDVFESIDRANEP